MSDDFLRVWMSKRYPDALLAKTEFSRLEVHSNIVK